MEQTQHPSPPTERQRPGRMLATIVRVTTREHGYIFVRLVETGEECFVHKSTVPPEMWEDLSPGDAVTCKVQETSKGLRGHDIRTGTPTEQVRVAEEEEHRGNRGPRHSER